MDEQACVCGHNPACGYAAIGDQRYCHDDSCSWDSPLTCYEMVGVKAMQNRAILAMDEGGNTDDE